MTQACPTQSPSRAPTSVPTAAPTEGPTKNTEKPIVTVFGSDQVTIEASRGAYYADQGGFCSDLTDGDISKGVIVSGAVFPQLDQTGEYKVQYECTNKRQITADKATRRIIVRDSQCPVCTIATDHLGLDGTIEASFPYVDDGATCSDTLDGLIENVVITNPVDVEQTGLYLVTYRARDKNGNWNDGSCKNSKQYIRTVRVVDTLKPVIGLHYNGANLASGLRSRRLLVAADRGVTSSASRFAAATGGAILIMSIAAAVYAAGSKSADRTCTSEVGSDTSKSSQI